METEVHLGPSRRLMLDELMRNPDVRYTRSSSRIQEMAKAHGLNPKTLDAALWDLEKRKLIRKERTGGREVYFFYQEQASAEVGSGSERLGEKAPGRPVKYTVAFTRSEDGYIVASVPALPGCHSQGRSLEEARRNIREAMRGYLASIQYRGEPIPEEEVVEQIEVVA